MRDVEKVSIEYVGYKDPSTTDEVDMEILGLESAICAIKHRIATLKQGVQLERMVSKSHKEASNAKNIKPAEPNTQNQ